MFLCVGLNHNTSVAIGKTLILTSDDVRTHMKVIWFSYTRSISALQFSRFMFLPVMYVQICKHMNFFLRIRLFSIVSLLSGINFHLIITFSVRSFMFSSEQQKFHLINITFHHRKKALIDRCDDEKINRKTLKAQKSFCAAFNSPKKLLRTLDTE